MQALAAVSSTPVQACEERFGLLQRGTVGSPNSSSQQVSSVPLQLARPHTSRLLAHLACTAQPVWCRVCTVVCALPARIPPFGPRNMAAHLVVALLLALAATSSARELRRGVAENDGAFATCERDCCALRLACLCHTLRQHCLRHGRVQARPAQSGGGGALLHRRRRRRWSRLRVVTAACTPCLQARATSGRC